MLNFSATCAAKSFNSICCEAGTVLGDFPSHPFQPTINSRKGYAATDTRARGSVGNRTDGTDPASAPATKGNIHAAAAVLPHCSRNCLRVGLMRASVTEKYSRQR